MCTIHRQVIRSSANLNDAADVCTRILFLSQQASLANASRRNNSLKHSTCLGENLDFETMHNNCSCCLLKFALWMKLDAVTIKDFERRRDRGAWIWLLLPGRKGLGGIKSFEDSCLMIDG